jgi:HEPN domain-containing protein
LYICEKQSLNDKVKYWVELSEYDFETAEAMQVSGRYLYVGFMCHQTVEKILKAYFSSRFIELPPFSHNLSYLTEKAGLNDSLTDEQINFINLLEPLNIEARYPTHKAELLKSLSKGKCEEILLKTKIFQEWVKERL